MSVKLSTRQVGDVSVIDVTGRITLGEGSSALRDSLRELVGHNQKKILLNLGDVSYIDSSGIGELVSGFTTVTNAGGQLKLLNLSKRVKDLLTELRVGSMPPVGQACLPVFMGGETNDRPGGLSY
ncbi:MAG: STAS domain-containing protein [Bryobacteraceae bacterium]